MIIQDDRTSTNCMSVDISRIFFDTDTKLFLPTKSPIHAHVHSLTKQSNQIQLVSYVHSSLFTLVCLCVYSISKRFSHTSMVCRVVCLKAFLGSKHPAEDKVKEILFVTKWLPFSSPIVCSLVV